MRFVIGSLVVALVLALGISRYASSQPDGLEKVAADQGIDAGESKHATADGPLADYETKGIDDPALARGVAGAIGVLACFGLATMAVGVASRHRRRQARVPDTDRERMAP